VGGEGSTIGDIALTVLMQLRVMAAGFGGIVGRWSPFLKAQQDQYDTGVWRAYQLAKGTWW